MRSKIELYNEDCMEGMKRYPDKYFDLIITSPPYNLGDIHHTGNKRHNPYPDNLPEPIYQSQQIDFINECIRLLKTKGSMFYNHKNRIRQGKSISPYQWILKTNAIIKQEIIWKNRSQNFDKIRFYPTTERIYWLSKNTETLFYNNINHDEVFNWNPAGINDDHNRAFPIKLVKTFLSCFPSGRVLDPYIGSGTTAIACWDMGFDLVGFEIDKDYFDAAMKRFENHKKQLQLF